MEKLLCRQKGFTVMEILLVIVSIGILVSIIIIALSPGKQLGDTRNAQRRVDINLILNAVHQYSLDNNRSLPTTITSTDTEICYDSGSCLSLIVLSKDLVPNYIVSIPVDPSINVISGLTTGYTISKNITTGRVTVSAPNAENSAIIAITR